MKLMLIMLLIPVLVGCSRVKFNSVNRKADMVKNDSGIDGVELDHGENNILNEDEFGEKEVDEIVERETSRNDNFYINLCKRGLHSTFNSKEFAAEAVIANFTGVIHGSGTSISKIDDVYGHIGIEVNKIDSIESVSGIMKYYGKDPVEGASSIIEHMCNIRGITIVCGMNVSKVSNFYGGLIVIDGNIEQVDQMNGLIRVINGNVGKVTNSRGLIKITNGNIDSVENHYGGLLLDSGTTIYHSF